MVLNTIWRSKQGPMKKLWMVIWLSSQCVALTAQIDSRALEQILIREQTEQAPGLVVGLWQNGVPLFMHSSGLSNLEHGIKANPKTTFHLSFLSQQFIEYSIMQLVKEGKLDRNDPVTQYLDWLPQVFEKVQIRHLLNHSSGLPDYWALRVLAGWGYDDPMSTAQAVAMISNINQLNQEPGEKTLYANTNPFLLAQVIEALSGQSIGKYLDSQIFTPLGMKNASVITDHTALVRNKASTYAHDGKAWNTAFSHHADVGPWGVYASMEDLRLWLNHLAQLPPSDQTELWKTQIYQGNEYRYRVGFYNGYRGFIGTFGDGYHIAILSADLYLNSWNQAMEIMGLLNPGEDSRGTTDPTSRGTKTIAFDPNLYVGDYWDPKEFHSRSIRYERDTLYYVTPDGWRSALEATAQHEFKMLQSAAGRKVWFNPAGLEPEMAVGYSQDDAYRYYAYDAITPSVKELEELVGDYYLPDLKAIYSLYVQDGKLYAKHFRNPPLRLDPLDRDRFANEDEWYFSMVSFQRNMKGQITGFRLDTPELTGLFFHKTDLPK